MDNLISNEELSEVMQRKLADLYSVSVDDYINLRVQGASHKMAFGLILQQILPWMSFQVNVSSFTRIRNLGATEEQVFILSSKGQVAYETYLNLLSSIGPMKELTPQSAWRLVQNAIDDEEELLKLHKISETYVRAVDMRHYQSFERRKQPTR